VTLPSARVHVSAAEPSVFFLMRIRRSGIARNAARATAAVSRFPNVADDESEDGTNDAAAECAHECSRDEINQPSRRNSTAHSSEQHGPRGCRPPERAEYSDGNRAAVDESLATRLVEIVGQRAEPALLFDPAVVAKTPERSTSTPAIVASSAAQSTAV
jgi:hypothetical protein